MWDYLRKNKNLSLVWFIGRGATHHLQIRLAVVFLGILSSSILILFGLLSTIFLFHTSHHRGQLRAEVIGLKENLFAMQVKYENAVESVYQENGADSLFTKIDRTNDLSLDVEQSTIAENMALGSSESRNPSNSSKDPEKLEAEQGIAIVPDKSSEASAVGRRWQVEALQVKFSDSSNQLQVSYRVTHRRGDQRSTGYVWGILAFKAENSSSGQLSYIAAPDLNLLAQNSGEIRDHSLGDRFYIRRFRDQVFSFDLPTGAKPAWIKLQVADDSGVIDAQLQKSLGETSKEKRATKTEQKRLPDQASTNQKYLFNH